MEDSLVMPTACSAVYFFPRFDSASIVPPSRELSRLLVVVVSPFKRLTAAFFVSESAAR